MKALNAKWQPIMAAVLPRLLIGIVAFWNILCAVPFIFQAELYTSSFGLSGEVGIAVIRSFGVLFLMWTIPYLLAILHPYRWQILIVAAILMQAIGMRG